MIKREDFKLDVTYYTISGYTKNSKDIVTEFKVTAIKKDMRRTTYVIKVPGGTKINMPSSIVLRDTYITEQEAQEALKKYKNDKLN